MHAANFSPRKEFDSINAHVSFNKRRGAENVRHRFLSPKRRFLIINPMNASPTPDETARPTPSERIAEIQRNSYWNSLPQLATSASIVSSQLAIKHIVELETAIAREKERADREEEHALEWAMSDDKWRQRAEAAEARLAALRVVANWMEKDLAQATCMLAMDIDGMYVSTLLELGAEEAQKFVGGHSFVKTRNKWNERLAAYRALATAQPAPPAREEADAE